MIKLIIFLFVHAFAFGVQCSKTICASPSVISWLDPSRFKASLINADRFFSFSASLVIGRVAEDGYNKTASFPGQLNYTVTAIAQEPFSPAFTIANGAVILTEYAEYTSVDLHGAFLLGSSKVWHFEVAVFDDSNPPDLTHLLARNGTLIKIDGHPGQSANFTLLDPAEYWHNRTQSQTPGGSKYTIPSNTEWGNCSCAFRDSLLTPVPQANLSVLFDPSAGRVFGSTAMGADVLRRPDGPLDPKPNEITVTFNVQIRLFYIHSDGSRHPLRYLSVSLDDSHLGGFQIETDANGEAFGVWEADIRKGTRLPETFHPHSRCIFSGWNRFRVVTAANPTDPKIDSWVAASDATCSSKTNKCLLDFTLDWNALGGTGTLWHHLSNIWESTSALLGTDDIPRVDVWYPASDALSGGYFDSGHVFIAIATSARDNPDAIAHEYGHYFHYMVMGRWMPQTIGGAHSFCQPQAQAAADAWVEGYATAFSLRVQQKVPTFSWTTSPDVSFQGTSIEHFKCASQKDMKFAEGRVAAGLWDVMDFAGGQDDPAHGAECNGGDESLGATGHCDSAGLGPANWVLRDAVQGRHPETVDDWVTYVVPQNRGGMGQGWLESMRYNYYLGPSGLAEVLQIQKL